MPSARPSTESATASCESWRPPAARTWWTTSPCRERCGTDAITPASHSSRTAARPSSMCARAIAPPVRRQPCVTDEDEPLDSLDADSGDEPADSEGVVVCPYCGAANEIAL